LLSPSPGWVSVVQVVLDPIFDPTGFGSSDLESSNTLFDNDSGKERKCLIKVPSCK